MNLVVVKRSGCDRLPMFSIHDVEWILGLTGGLGIEVWLDGGWAVDAHVGRQTRPHRDLDIALQTHDSQVLQSALEDEGFVEIGLEYRRPYNFVYANSDGREIDFHLFDFDADGNGVYGDRGPIYPAAALNVWGRIGVRRVRCMGPTEMVGFHTGYEHDDDDVHDVKLLCETFGIALPEQYR
jgi:lincosamide nucleotidyltransferase A/C/D/E